MNATDQNITPRRLPLWKACLDFMQQEGIVYGKTYSAEFFEQQLECSKESMQFGLAISEIRRALENDGFYLSGRGQKGNQFVILPPESNSEVMKSYERAATEALKRGVILGTNTRLDTLSECDRKNHEKVLERIATKAVLLQRSRSIAAVVAKSKPKLLAPKLKAA